MRDYLAKLADYNFARLSVNAYPGRGIVAGLNAAGTRLIQIYWIMGRSLNSKNRVFKIEDKVGRLYTEAADAAKMTDPSLVIYNAMRQRGPHFIVSNGDQTDTVAEAPGPLYLNVALEGRTYEPDAPNFTQRITAVSSLSKGPPIIQMSILRKSEFGDGCDRLLHEFNPSPGFGHCITTYEGDGDPLPPFRGEPILMPLLGEPMEIMEAYWGALNEKYRVSLAMKIIEIGNGSWDMHVLNANSQR